MGGKLFSDALPTPRMTPARYMHVRDHVVNQLRVFYKHVCVPREAPGKTSYGDVDVLVGGWRRSTSDGGDDMAVVGEALRAERVVRRGSRAWSVAVSSKAVPGVGYEAGDVEEEPEGVYYHQIDITTCAFPDGSDGGAAASSSIRWMTILKSDGDMWNIIGVMVRRVGLCVNERGLHVRVLEMEAEKGEKHNWMAKKHRKVLLTAEPARILQFLGLDQEAYERGWSEMKELFDWIAASRVFHPGAFGGARAGKSDAVEDEEQEKQDDEDDEDDEEGDHYIKPTNKQSRREQKRIQDRPMFRAFMLDYLPTYHPSSSSSARGHRPELARATVLQDALSTFDKHAEYAARVQRWRNHLVMRDLWRTIAETQKDLDKGDDAQRLGLLMRGLKRRLVLSSCAEQQQEDSISQPPVSLRLVLDDKDGSVIDTRAVMTWVEQNAERVYEEEKKRVEELQRDRGKGKNTKNKKNKNADG